MTDAAKVKIAGKYAKAVQETEKWKKAMTEATDSDFRTICLRNVAAFEAESEAVEEVVKMLGHKIKRSRKTGAFKVVPDLNSVKTMAEVASLPEDKRLYGDDFGYEN